MFHLEFKNVSLAYPYEPFALIDSLSFQLEKCGILGVVIAPQCGKSTVAKLIAGLKTPSSGEILLNGAPLNDIHPRERGAAVIYDGFALMKNRKYWVNAAYTLKIRKVKLAERKNAAINALEKFGLGGKGDCRVKLKKMPDADKLALALARASLREFDLIVFDDVFKKIDAEQARRHISVLLENRQASQIYLSSDVNELHFCHKIIVVADGKNQFSGSFADANEFVETSGCFGLCCEKEEYENGYLP